MNSTSSTTTPSLDTLAQHDADGTMFSPSLQIVLYANTPLPELAAGAIACYQLVVQQFGGALTLYHTRSMRTTRHFEQKYVDVFPTLCGGTEPGLPGYRVFNGANLQDFAPPALTTGSYATNSFLQLHLPPALADDWEQVWALLTWMALPFPFRFGTVGYALCWNDVSVDRSNEVPRLIGPLLKRHPGLNIGTPREICDQPMPPVNWVTLLGPEQLEQAGGIGLVQQAFADESQIQVAPLGPGAVVRAGAVPRLGDRNRRDDLPLYRRVGAYLKQFRGQQEIELDGLSLEESEKWLARFDR